MNLSLTKHGLKCTVVIVEDDASVLRSIGRLVKAAGYEVLSFQSPIEALEADLPVSGGCMVLDVHLPVMNAIEFWRVMRGEGNKLPVIMMTGHLDDGTTAAAKEAEPVALLIKPFTKSELLQAISRALTLND